MAFKADGPDFPPYRFTKNGVQQAVPQRDEGTKNVPVGQGGKAEPEQEQGSREITYAKSEPTDPPKEKNIVIGKPYHYEYHLFAETNKFPYFRIKPSRELVWDAPGVRGPGFGCTKISIETKAESGAGVIITGNGGGGDTPSTDDKVNDPTDLIWKKLGVGGNIGTGEQLDDYVDNGLTGHVFNATYIHGYVASVDFNAPIDDTHKDNTAFTGGFDNLNTGADPTNPADDVKITGTAEYFDDNHNSVLITTKYADGGIKEKALYVPAPGDERIVYVYDFGKADEFNVQNPKTKSTISDVMEFNEEERAKILNNQIYSRPGEWKSVDDKKSDELDLIAKNAPRVQMKTRSGNTKDIPDDCNKYYKTEANGKVYLYIKGENGWWSQDCSLEVTNRQLEK